MARNQEKAQAMLNRFLAARREGFGGVSGPSVERKPLVSEVHSVVEAEKWRLPVVRKISQKMSEIQNGSLGEHRIRSINDELNKLMREKWMWEKRIRDLGGKNFAAIARSAAVEEDEPLVVTLDGSKYMYFGEARNLPGVKEMFEAQIREKAVESKKPDLEQLYDMVDLHYLGFHDEDDGELVEQERSKELEIMERRIQEFQERMLKSGSEPLEFAEPQEHETNASLTMDSEQLEQMVLERKKQEIMQKYGFS